MIWVVYPYGIALCAAMRQRNQHPAGERSPSVSIILATREDAAAIRTRVENFWTTTYDPAKIEVVVAVDGRSEAAGEILADSIHPPCRRVQWVRGDEPGGKAAALNAGVRAAHGEVLVFADSHQRFEPEAIPKLVAALGDPRVGAASGSLELPVEEGRRSLVGWYWIFERWLRRNEARVHSTVGVTGAIYAMRRSLWQPLPPGLILDDVYVPMRVVLQGFRVAFARDARALETRRPNNGQEYRRKVRTLTGNFQLCAWLPNVLIPFRNPIWLQFVFHKLLRLLTPYLLLIIGIWFVIATGRWIGNHLPYSAAVLGAVAVLLAAARPGLIRPLRNALYQGALLQAAVVAATINGVRGRWDVWSK